MKWKSLKSFETVVQFSQCLFMTQNIVAYINVVGSPTIKFEKAVSEGLGK